MASGFFAAGSFASGFFVSGFFGAGTLASGFFAAGSFAAAFFAAAFFAADSFAAGSFASGFLESTARERPRTSYRTRQFKRFAGELEYRWSAKQGLHLMGWAQLGCSYVTCTYSVAKESGQHVRVLVAVHHQRIWGTFCGKSSLISPGQGPRSSDGLCTLQGLCLQPNDSL